MLNDNYTRNHETELVDVAEMADRLGLTPKAFKLLVRSAGIPKIRMGHRTVRYAPETVIAFVTARFTTNGSNINP